MGKISWPKKVVEEGSRIVEGRLIAWEEKSIENWMVGEENATEKQRTTEDA